MIVYLKIDGVWEVNPFLLMSVVEELPKDSKNDAFEAIEQLYAQMMGWA